MRDLIEPTDDGAVLLSTTDAEGIGRLFPGWRVELLHLGRGPLRWSGAFVPLGPLHMITVAIDSGGILRGLSPRARANLIWTRPGSASIRVAARLVGGDACYLLGSRAPFDWFAPAGCSMLILALAAAAARGERIPGQLPRRGGVHVHALSNDHIEVLSRCMDLLEELQRSPTTSIFLRSLARIKRRAQDRLLPAVASVFTDSAALPADCSERAPRSEAVARARAYVETHLHEPLTLEDLCRASGVRARTLEYGFAEAYDIGPMQYLKAVRLDRVRRDLLKARKATAVVSQTARRWSFSHMGQFSRDYRLAYGESPSQTIARTR
ncbi:MAG TPA: helix-turn-helix domain-containing protein [Steroidobacter sp.]|nr:helix-turn-helix domain-containing protein [Steroidobacter sp.]